MRPEDIKTALETALSPSHLEVEVEGSHVHVVVVSSVFEGLNAVKKQQAVYAAFGDAISSGAVHAVHMKTYTPNEWAAH